MSNDLIPLGIGHNDVPAPTEVVTINATVNTEISEARSDFQIARDNILVAIQTSSNAMATLAQVADQVLSSKYYDSLSTMIKTAVDANRTLVELHKTRRELGEGNGPKVVKNQLIMTSAAMLDLINGQGNPEDESVEIKNIPTDK
jgi:hypothetical protein